MGELLVLAGLALVLYFAYRGGRQVGYSEGYSEGASFGALTEAIKQAEKDSARARKAAATRKQRAAIVELGNSEV